MINKFIKYLYKDLKRNYKFYLVLLFVLLLFTIHFDYYIYSPGGLVDLTDRIKVDNSYKSDGSFNLTYVMAREANIPNIILSYIIPSWDLVSLDNLRVDNESENEIEQRDKIYLKETSYDAIIAAFSEANIEYKVDNIQVIITHIYDQANTDVKVGDVIKSINGIEITNTKSIQELVKNYKEDDKINIRVLRDNKIIDCYSVLFKENNKIYIGISLAELKDITTDPKVEYVFKENESGSSRGLLCALDIYNKITEYDLTKGKTISGTGVIYEDGSIGAIDGVKYKLKGAVNNKADVFIVPSDNYEEAIKLKEKNNYDIIIIEADTLHNVILKLKELN